MLHFATSSLHSLSIFRWYKTHVNGILQTTLPIRDIVSALSKEGFNVMESYDAGRFVCNYVYYHSLRHAQVSGVKSLFVHVPSFHFINQECQLEFIAALLKVLAMFCWRLSRSHTGAGPNS